jgi:hypothetical protein
MGRRKLAESSAVLATEKMMIGQWSISRFLASKTPTGSVGRMSPAHVRVRSSRQGTIRSGLFLSPKTASRRRLLVSAGERHKANGLPKVPHGDWKLVTFIGALRHDRVTAPFSKEPVTGEMFHGLY